MPSARYDAVPDIFQARSKDRDAELSAIDDELRRLVQASDDPRDKAMLLILQQINHTLNENTFATSRIANATQDTAKQLAMHMETFNAWKNRGMGAWKVGVSMIAIIQALIIWIFAQHLNGFNSDSEVLRATVNKMGILEYRLETMERQQNVVINQIMNSLRNPQTK